jgi:predicted O-linked N-acetylglucosamine transferase (SPINDLY family)
MGVPVVSLAGDAYAGRTGASALERASLGELVAHTPEQVVGIALGLARQPDELRTLRAGLRARLRASPLLDAARFTRALEEAYRAMWEEKLRVSGSPAG